ncbi:MAG: transposase [Patescibacteria group bacterium]|nr:transposase [Patescibacteria group bacterium]
MPNRREQLVNGEIYHIVIRRIEDYLLFKDIDDYYRGIFSIYEFNTTKPVEIAERRRIRIQMKKDIKAKGDPLSPGGERVSPALTLDGRERLVDILAFCFMPNHIHLLLRQLKGRGITTFMNKIGAGYPAYFKQKHGIKTKGYFFQDRFVSVHVKTDEQLKIAFVYIHANPASLIEPKWKEIGIKNPKKVIEFLENYKWSSYQDYLGKKNFPSVIEKDFLLEVMGGKQGCKDFLEDWIKYKGEIRKFANLSLGETRSPLGESGSPEDCV